MPDIQDTELGQMIADHMENGFLENIIDMYRHDKSLYRFVGELIKDERIRVRIGTTALMEELKKLDPANVKMAKYGLLPLIEDPDPVVRGDVANLLGLIGGSDLLPYLNRLLLDENENVRLIAKEAVEELPRQ